MSVAQGPPFYRITISRLGDKQPIARIAAWCLENEISFAVKYSDTDFNMSIVLEADAATLAKLKFQI